MMREVWENLDVDETVNIAKSLLLLDASPGMGIYVDFARHCDIEDFDDFDPTQDESLVAEFNEYLDWRVREIVGEEISRLAYDIQVEGTVLLVYRSIVVPYSWGVEDVGSRSLGVCWSWDWQFAVPHSGGGNANEVKEVKLSGKVEVNGIDWEMTVALNAMNSLIGEDEREIRLREDAEVMLFKVEEGPYLDCDFNDLHGFNEGPYLAGERLETLTP